MNPSSSNLMTENRWKGAWKGCLCQTGLEISIVGATGIRVSNSKRGEQADFAFADLPSIRKEKGSMKSSNTEALQKVLL
jgi:hypothetical protein